MNSSVLSDLITVFHPAYVQFVFPTYHMSSRASLNAPPGLRETWRQLDQGILPEHLGGKPNPKSTASQPTMPDSRTKVAIIGYGLSAKIFHIPLILALPDSYTLHSIVQRNPTPSSSAQTDHPSITTYRTVDAMLADAAVDLVIVTTTPETHFELASQALESGKHVVVEKPFVPTSAEARKLSALAKAKGLLLAVYQNRRWDVDFLTLKQVLTQGTLGHVAEFESHFDRFRPSVPEAGQVTWKNKVVPAGGALFDLGSHLIDQVYALYGVPKSVWGVVQVQKKGLKIGQVAPDACTVVLRYGSEEEETLVTVKSSSISAGETLRYWVRGDKGSFTKVSLISSISIPVVGRA